MSLLFANKYLYFFREGKQFRESRVETPSHTGGVSEEALKREEERRNKAGRGLKVNLNHLHSVLSLLSIQIE